MSLFSNNKVKLALRWLLILFYFVAGLNHFIHPEFYLPLIPSYLPKPELLNVISGMLEVVLAIGVVIPKFRKSSIILIILMLIAFIPSHIYFIQEGACMNQESLCTPIWIAWFRLIVIHPIFILWAWYVRE